MLVLICRTSDFTDSNKPIVYSIYLNQEPPFDAEIDNYCNLEGVGIKEELKISDDDEAIKHFQKTIQFIDKRYQIRFLLKIPNTSIK